MPISYRIEGNLVLTTASGVLTDDDILQLKKQLVGDPAFKPGMGELSDVRAVEQLAVTPEGVRLMVQHDAAHADQVRTIRLAIVVAKDEVFGMARMYQMLTEGTVDNVKVFRDIAEARAWLEAWPG
jgi:hypothetical protein